MRCIDCLVLLSFRCCRGFYSHVSVFRMWLRVSVSPSSPSVPGRLSWADTAASTFGRLYGPSTGKLPSGSIPVPLPLLKSNRWPRLGFAARKSVAGFIASTTTGFLIATSFWGCFAQFRDGPPHASWSPSSTSGRLRGTIGLLTVGGISGLISGVTEALGTFRLGMAHL